MATTKLCVDGLGRAAQVVMADISHGAVGTGTTAPVVTDVALETETDRVATTKAIRDANLFQHRTFFLNSQMPSPNVEEAGWYMNGSGAANSGDLLCRAIFTFVKGSQDLLLIFEGLIQEEV